MLCENFCGDDLKNILAEEKNIKYDIYDKFRVLRMRTNKK